MVYYFELIEEEQQRVDRLIDEIPEIMKTEFVSLADHLRQEGMEQTKKRAVQNMLRMGFEHSIICEIQEVTPEFVEQIRQEMQKYKG